MRKNARIKIILRMRKVSSGSLFSIDIFCMSNNSVSWQRMPWSDCADAQAGLGLRCPHMPEDTLSHGVAQVKIRVNLLAHIYADKVNPDQAAQLRSLIRVYFGR